MTSSNGNIFSTLLAICAGNSLVTGEFPSQRPVTRSFDVFFDLCLNKPQGVIVQILSISSICLFYFLYSNLPLGCIMMGLGCDMCSCISRYLNKKIIIKHVMHLCSLNNQYVNSLSRLIISNEYVMCIHWASVSSTEWAMWVHSARIFDKTTIGGSHVTYQYG